MTFTNRRISGVGPTGLKQSLHGITQSDPEILNGEPVFVGTRVPVRSLFEYLEGGETLPEFLQQFPSVRREQALAVLESACETVIADAIF